MPTELIEREIRRFFSSKNPEVLCVRGKWGIGKTFSWKQQLAQAQKDNTIGLDRYAYVSLFGVNSLEELRQAIFQNPVWHCSLLGAGCMISPEAV